MNISLSDFFLHLLVQKNFYAQVANAMRRVPSPGMGTMGVGIRDGSVVLYYDPAFVEKISLKFGVYAIEHEIMHIVLDHIPRYYEFLGGLGNNDEERQKAVVVANIAMDCADNDLLRKHAYFDTAEKEFRQMQLDRYPPEIQALMSDVQKERMGMVLPEKEGLPLNKAFEFYQEALMKRVKLMSKDEVEALISMWIAQQAGAHDQWIDQAGDGEGDSEGKGDKDKDAKGESKNGKGNVSTFRKPPPSAEEALGKAHQIRTQLKELLKTVIKKQEKSQGTVPGEIAEWLAEYLADPIIPWWEVLTTRIMATKRSKPDRGIQRPNRSLLSMSEEDDSILPAIGVLRDPRYRVFFYVDTSGSMHSESLAIARAELTNLLKSDDDLEVRYMQGDAATHFDEVFHSGQELPKEAYGRGGTDFNEYFRYMWQYMGNDETAPDLVIVYTDGWAPAVDPDNRLPPETPVIWLVTKHHASQSLEGYGEIIVADPDHNDTWKYQK